MSAGPAAPVRGRPGAAARALLGVIRAYQLLISPLLGPRCRHLPGCADYAAEAIAVHGVARGVALAAHRLARCHPWGTSGYDPVPPAPRGGATPPEDQHA